MQLQIILQQLEWLSQIATCDIIEDYAIIKLGDLQKRARILIKPLI